MCLLLNVRVKTLHVCCLILKSFENQIKSCPVCDRHYAGTECSEVLNIFKCQSVCWGWPRIRMGVLKLPLLWLVAAVTPSNLMATWCCIRWSLVLTGLGSLLRVPLSSAMMYKRSTLGVPLGGLSIKWVGSKGGIQGNTEIQNKA
jgi:hypothetical protein